MLPTSKKVKQAKKDLRLSYEQEQAAYVQSKIDEIKSAADNKQSALAWKTVNEISGRKKTTKAKIKANDQAERVSKWKDHFQNLLGNPPNVLNRPTQKIFENELDIKKGPFTMDELEDVLKKSAESKGMWP